MSLRQKIEQEIRERGLISFSRYMEMCLYDPELGYYSRNAEQFGKAGDFYTSSDVHAVFGRLLARQFEEMWRVFGSPSQIELLELGPGRGLFAQDVLDWTEKKFSEFFSVLHYSLLEKSGALRARLRSTLKERLEAGKASLVEQGRTLASEVPVIVFANEFFDALPVEVLSPEGSLSLDVANGRFVERWKAPSAQELEFLHQYGVRPQAGERIEVPLVAQAFMSEITAKIENGFILVIDYGYAREEQLAGRHRGTIQAFRRHSVSASPYEAPGEQDITAHVNFTPLAAAARANGMEVQPLLTQSQFLMGVGEANQFADAFEECRLPQERAKVALQLKHLVTPAGMGESFHVLVAGKGEMTRPAATLSGMSFGKEKTLSSR